MTAYEKIEEQLKEKPPDLIDKNADLIDLGSPPDEKVNKEVIASGLPASPGAASGKVVFNATASDRILRRLDHACQERACRKASPYALVCRDPGLEFPLGM